MMTCRYNFTTHSQLSRDEGAHVLLIVHKVPARTAVEGQSIDVDVDIMPHGCRVGHSMRGAGSIHARRTHKQRASPSPFTRAQCTRHDVMHVGAEVG